MERNKYSILSLNEQDLNDKYLLLIYATFRINIEQMFKNFLYICKDYHIQPSEINKMPYYQYELYLEEINAIQKEQEKENKQQQEMHNSITKNMNPNSIMKNMSNSMSNLNLPKVNIPKL